MLGSNITGWVFVNMDSKTALILLIHSICCEIKFKMYIMCKTFMDIYECGISRRT